MHFPFFPKLPPIQAGTYCWSDFPVLFSKTLLVIHFKDSSVYLSIPNSLSLVKLFLSHVKLEGLLEPSNLHAFLWIYIMLLLIKFRLDYLKQNILLPSIKCIFRVILSYYQVIDNALKFTISSLYFELSEGKWAFKYLFVSFHLLICSRHWESFIPQHYV